MLQYLLDVSSGIFIFLLNIPLFIVGFKRLSKKFMIFTFISAFLLSFYLTILKSLNLPFKIDDIILSAIFGGVLNGIGMGILFRYGASQGGLDILALIFKRDYNLNISEGLMLMNGIIISVASFLFGLERGLYTVISMYVAYQVVDKVINGFDEKKQFIIISDKAEEVANKIMVDPHRGVTLLEAKGAYSKKQKQVIYCVAYNRQVVRIKQVVAEIDPNAFISISNMVEVSGKGFIKREV